MNMWGFNTGPFVHLREHLTEFLKRHGQEEKSEIYIPLVVNDLVTARKERCKVLRTSNAWFGVTHREDRPFVVEGIRELIARGGLSGEALGVGVRACSGFCRTARPVYFTHVPLWLASGFRNGDSTPALRAKTYG
jgi:hypothetical protein